jgi:hypothetical protein
MSTRERQLVMFGVKLSFEEGERMFFEDHENGDYRSDRFMGLPYRIQKDVRDQPVVVVDDCMSCEYMIAGRVVDYADSYEGETLGFTMFSPEEPITAAQKQETIDTLRFAGLSEEELERRLTYIVFTHVS